jgi:hypothetical protein
MVSLSELNGFEKRFWNGFGNLVGIVWELFGNCLELSDTDYQLVNMLKWELFGNCLGIVWEF